MKLATLRSRALRDELEVEHILRAAKERHPDLADELERLIDDCGWTDGGPTALGVEIPFRKWALTAIAYCRTGHAGLAELVRSDRSYLTFVLALLEELADADALEAALLLLAHFPLDASSDLSEQVALADTFNLLLSFKQPVATTAGQRSVVRERLHALLPMTHAPEQRDSVLCALRGVGDAESLRIIDAGSPLPYPWAGIERAAAKAIKARLRRERA